MVREDLGQQAELMRRFANAIDHTRIDDHRVIGEDTDEAKWAKKQKRAVARWRQMRMRAGVRKQWGRYSVAGVSRLSQNLLPGLPNDVALECLVRLPRGLTEPLSRVSRAWRYALQAPLIDAVKRSAGWKREEWVLLCRSLPTPDMEWKVDEMKWHLIDPVRGVSMPINPPPMLQRRSKSVVAMPTGQAGMAIVQSNDPEAWTGRESVMLSFDALQRQWHEQAPACMQKSVESRPRFKFASACVGHFLYAAGGTDKVFTFGGRPDAYLSSAERLDLRSGKWESLPNMHEKRSRCAGVVLNGRFCVIGGFRGEDNQHVASGEIWDPDTHQWQLVPNMYPPYMTPCGRMWQLGDTDGLLPFVVVQGELYGIDFHSKQLMWWARKSTASSMQDCAWQSLGALPTTPLAAASTAAAGGRDQELREFDWNACQFYKCIVVGDRFCVLWWGSLMFTTRPMQRPLSWELLDLSKIHNDISSADFREYELTTAVTISV